MLLFATEPEKGSFRAFLTVRKLAFQIHAASQDENQKNSKKCLLPCLLLILCFCLLVYNGVKNKEKTTISCGFPVELIAGFEPATSSLPKTDPKLDKEMPYSPSTIEIYNILCFSIPYYIL